MTRTRKHFVAPGLIAIALIVSVTASSCAPTAEREAPSFFQNLSKLSKQAEPALLELGAVGKQQPSKVDELRSTLGRAPAGTRTVEQSAIITRAEMVMLFWDEVSQVIVTADDVAQKIPREAIGLASMAFTPDADPRVIAYFDDLATKALKSVSCATAQSLLTDAEASSLDGIPLTYDPSAGLTRESLVAYFQDGNARLTATLTAEGHPVNFYSFASQAFAKAAIGKAQTWINAAQGVLTAPDGTIQRAYIYYIRLCLVKTGSG